MASLWICAAARPSWAATVTFGSFSEGKTASNTTSVSVGLPSGLAAGDLLIAAVATDGNTSASLSAPLGQGWTLISRNAQATAATLGVWWKIASGSELAAQQFTWSTNERAYGWIMRFQGHDPVAPIHVFAITGGTATSPACPSVTTTVPNTMLLRIGGFDDPTINVDNAGMVGHTTITMDFSHSGTGAASGGAAYIMRPSTGSTGTSSFVLTASQEYRAMTLAIAPAECVSASECDDGNLCTTDTCNASGLCENNNNSLPCNDGSPCTLGDACSGGACVGGPPPNCSGAGNACNTASCDPGGTEGNCAVLTPVPNGTTCDDGLFCTATDTCQGGVCTGAGDPCPGLFCLEVSDNCVECRFSSDCDDGIACTVDTCSGNVCSNTVNHPACNDGLFCNGAETCSATLGCQAGTPPCPDSVSCTVDSCDEGNNTCSNAPNDAACEDGLFCNGAETCDALLDCLAGASPCDDAVACTDDACNESLDTCSNTANNSNCDDGLFCNGVESCDALLDCQSGTAPCVDAVACTDDSCNETLDTCVNAPNNANCNDGLFCNGAETCDALLGCLGGTAPCNDAVPCTDDSCNETLDACSNTPNSANCDDGLFCNGAESCHATLGCQGGAPPCDDGVTCTDDSCDEPTDACTNIENDALCDDALFCNGVEMCDAVLDCLAGVSPCVDAVDCTDNACDEPSDTCTFPLNDANCDDADPCTTDTCTPGGCVTSPGATITVDLDLEGINTPVSRDVTFAITDCDGGTDTRVINVDFDAVGAAQVVIGSVTGVSDWISAVEGHTLRRLAPLSFVACSALVDLTGGARVMGGDFQTGAVAKDNLVDVTDFSILATRWNQPIDATLSTGADATGDGFQSTADFAAIQANFLLVGDAVDGCPATAADVIVTGYGPLDDGTYLPWPGPADDDEGDGMDVGNASLPDDIDEWSARNPIELSHRLDAAVPLARLRVSQLPSRELRAADLDGDGFVDANDIRLFAEIHGLDLSPRFRVERDALKPEPRRRTRR